LCKGTVDSNDTRNEYIDIFRANGINCKLLPTLRFEFVNLQRLTNSLLLPSSYSGLILTSRRSVEAIDIALANEENNDLAEVWKNSPAYCVGPATASLARSKLKLRNRLGSECGNATDLSNYIVEQRSEDTRPLLYPCSSIVRDTIERILGTNEINVEKIQVYNTLPIETLESDLEGTIDDSAEIFVFFSPSAVEYTLNAVKHRKELLGKIRAVAIGPATADAIVKSGLTVHAVSSRPEPRALLEAIQSIFE